MSVFPLTICVYLCLQNRYSYLRRVWKLKTAQNQDEDKLGERGRHLD